MRVNGSTQGEHFPSELCSTETERRAWMGVIAVEAHTEEARMRRSTRRVGDVTATKLSTQSDYVHRGGFFCLFKHYSLRALCVVCFLPIIWFAL